jgi:hypothetical protein
MKDIFSLYQVMDAKTAYATVSGLGTRPGNIGDDFKLYVTSPNSTEVKAFRDGNTWYYADGTQANDGNVIFGGGVVTPLLQDTVKGDDILNPSFDPDNSFEDYTPQINWLPRLAFSFPISEDANFFAHYDVLVQRPPSNWQITPLINLFNRSCPRFLGNHRCRDGRCNNCGWTLIEFDQAFELLGHDPVCLGRNLQVGFVGFRARGE